MADPFALDPLSTVVQLAVLSRLEPGVKIGIVRNAIVIHRPNVKDWVRRTGASLFTQGCTKHALFHLRVPLERAVTWYYEKTPHLFEMALRGLGVLLESYKSDPSDGNVVDTIKLAIKTLKERDAIAPESLDGRPALRQLQLSWTDAEIAALTHVVPLMEREGPVPEHIVACVEELLMHKQRDLIDIIRSSPMAKATSKNGV